MLSTYTTGYFHPPSPAQVKQGQYFRESPSLSFSSQLLEQYLVVLHTQAPKLPSIHQPCSYAALHLCHLQAACPEWLKQSEIWISWQEWISALRGEKNEVTWPFIAWKKTKNMKTDEPFWVTDGPFNPVSHLPQWSAVGASEAAWQLKWSILWYNLSDSSNQQFWDFLRQRLHPNHNF